MSAEPTEGETVSIHADLRAYSSDALLHQRVFGSEEFIAWTRNESHLVLHLDSLDEALLRIDSIANLLASELPRYPVSRMSLRIACRTALWPGGILEPTLNRLWGEEAVRVVELAPLRRKDVASAATARGIDEKDFIRELHASNSVPFAIKPLTLNLLLGLFQREGSLPRSVVELYTRGCMKLCEESNLSRRDARRLGTLNTAQRLRLAGRLAAATMLANRYAIWTGPEADSVPEEDVPLSALSPAHEEGNFAPFDVSDDNVREVLDTGLFTSRGGVLMGWAHQSYAEFLAAKFLIEKKVSTSNILKILLHPAGGLVPQLAGVTAWIASLSGEVRETLIESEPLVLLQGDIASWGEADLAALTASLLTAFEKKNVRDYFPGIADYYAKLAHPEIATQLRPYITDSAKNIICRRAAIMIAESCAIAELQPELLEIALDTKCDPDLRARAVAALRTCGDDTVPAKILPLARSELGPDPVCGIKGHALQLLWPQHLTAAELFASITRPIEGHVGSYILFLTGTLPETLKPEDFPIALRWATSFIAEVGHNGEFHRKSLADSILIRAWQYVDRDEISPSLLEYVFTCLRGHHDLLRGTGRREQEQFRATLKSDAMRRRTFLRLVTPLILDRIDIYHLIRAGLLQREDLPWLLTLCPGAAASESAVNNDTLCSMIEMALDRDDPAQFEALYDAALNWPSLWDHFRVVFEGVALDSADAQALRRNERMMKELEGRKPPPVTPPPAERVADLLNQFEAGEWRAWWMLNRELTLTPTSTVYGDDLEYSITRMPGWIAADAATKERIVSAARRYLVIGETSVREWIGTTSANLNDLAAYRAFVLLKELDGAAYEQIPTLIWSKWAPAIASIPKLTGSERPKLHIDTVADALAAAPAEFVGTTLEMMRIERARTAAEPSAAVSRGASFFMLRDLDGCWDSEELKQGILAELCDTANSEDQFRTILDVLLTAGFIPARDFAIEIMADDQADDGPRALVAACALAVHCPEAWPYIWSRVSPDPDFARRFFLDLGASYRFQEAIFTELTEQQCAQAYILLLQLFPPSNDPQHSPGQAHFVGPYESLAHMRDGIIPVIVNRGTPAAVSAMRWIVSLLPDYPWLSFHLRDAEQVMRAKTWSPLTSKDVFWLTDLPSRLLVVSAGDLCELLVETLRKYEVELHGGQTPIRGLWDRQGGGKLFRPIEEDGLSDHVSLFLQRELVERAIVANREVEVSRVAGTSLGKRTDIRIDAIRKSDDGKAYDTVTAIIETKGCWNPDLKTALEDQLYADYLVRLLAPVGIYLVGWFDKAKWDPDDARRAATPNCSIAEMQDQLDAQAAAIPAGFMVRAVVLDCHAS
ncbi:hypothetical protein TSA1_05715 [Bradyrhizobium nitroreducens]|uniref:Uncharacterized protein n=1 Tax=Bradyrhizobium nitroreducens TaxID=709803 RepID=A0A2M6U6W3_9BRAD|nr:hypothetical protein TSA1_05715 [Bradyrhizobium nitroreducens]